MLTVFCELTSTGVDFFFFDFFFFFAIADPLAGVESSG
jgi:hypothetical protein